MPLGLGLRTCSPGSIQRSQVWTACPVVAQHVSAPARGTSVGSMTDSADFAVADDDEKDSWLSTPGLREAPIEAQADFAAGRTIGSQEIRARFGLPLRHVE